MNRSFGARWRGLLETAGSESLPPSAAGMPALGHPAFVMLVYALSCAALTWPLVTRLGTHLPLGTLGDATVPYFNLWTLEWNAQRLLHGYAGYWDAPLFHPAHDTFAMSEPQAFTGLLFAPLAWLFGPIAGYNLTLLLQLWLNGCAGWHLLRVLSASRFAAAVGGALFLGLPMVRSELGVLQLCAAWPVILGLAELVRLARDARGWAIVRLGLWLVISAWTCLYYALFLGLFVLLASAFFVRRALFTPRFAGAAVLALALVGGGLYPLYAAEQRAVSSQTRSAESIRSGSASVLAYLEVPRGTPLARLVPAWARRAGRRSLYPGALMCLLAGLGALRVRKVQPARLLWFAGASFVLALVLSFGTRWQLAGNAPYALTAQRFFPGFAQLRSPYRAALFVHLILAACAGVGLDVLPRLWAAWRPQLMAAVSIGCVACALLEWSVWGFPLQRFPREAMEEPWIAWLAQAPPGAVAMVPVTEGGHASAYTDTVVGMLQALRHGHPLVNGYSGFFPRRTDRLMSRLRNFPGPGSVPALRGSGVRYVVVDRTWPGARAIESDALTAVFTQGRRSVYSVR